ncbi:MAG: type II toxin-antitoxin system YafQ family toxin [Terracidiphilus sp.]|jgi:mRNA interferase YafQ
MRKISWTRQFKRDYKKLRSSPRYRGDLETLLPAVLDTLATDQQLDAKFKDHALTGEMAGFRECHLRPDLLLVYAKAEDPPRLILMRLGTHSELF